MRSFGVWVTMAHAENEAIKLCSGELIVFLQDYIHIEPDALEKFWYQYQQNPRSMITGVGHQYGKPGYKYGKDGITHTYTKGDEKSRRSAIKHCLEDAKQYKQLEDRTKRIQTKISIFGR